MIGINKIHSYYFKYVFISLFQQYQSPLIKMKLMQFHKLTPPVIIGAEDFLKRAFVTCDKEKSAKKVKAKLDIDW